MIGEGGMGVVYLAEHTVIGKKSAIKLLRPGSDEAAARFVNEARAAASLRHPGLVDVFDFGQHDGRTYIVMEFLDGESLAQRLARDTRLPVPIAVAITRQVASALHAAHKEGIIHRDLKPENIFLLADPDAPAGVRSKVLDFGIAKLVNEQNPRSVKTNSGTVIGTPRYMSPEQCKNARTVDGRADVYSLGCILFEMLVGVTPFDYDTWAELVAAHLYETPPRPRELAPTIPKDVELVLLKMLAKAPEDRQQSMQELAQALEVLWRTHANDSQLSFTPASGPPTVDPTRAPSGRIPRARQLGDDPTLRPEDSVDLKLPKPDEKPTEKANDKPDEKPAEKPIATTTEQIRKGRSPMWWAAVGGAGTVAVAAPLIVWRVMASKAPEDTLNDVHVTVDHRHDDTGDGRERATDNGGSAQPIVRDESAADPAGKDAGVGAAVKVVTHPDHPPPNPNETDTHQLTRAFERQTPAVAACFRKYPSTTNDAISIRFHVDLAGKVASAEVLPDAVASTPLGGCLVGVAKETTFGPQPKAVTFRVPIHANVGG
jgi:serine/threonine protein kinase